MQNMFGQDIQPGDYVGLGIRQGNGSEHRIGRVLQLVENDGEWKAKCLWYDAERSETMFAFESSQKFAGLFKVEPGSLSRRIRNALEIASNARIA